MAGTNKLDLATQLRPELTELIDKLVAEGKSADTITKELFRATEGTLEVSRTTFLSWMRGRAK